MGDLLTFNEHKRKRPNQARSGALLLDEAGKSCLLGTLSSRSLVERETTVRQEVNVYYILRAVCR
jgi:hypothetical protein